MMTNNDETDLLIDGFEELNATIEADKLSGNLDTSFADLRTCIKNLPPVEDD